MSLSKKANQKRMRAYRKAQAEYVHSLEAKVLALETDNTLLRAMLVQAEETGFSPEHEMAQDKRILQLEAEHVLMQTDLARIEMMVESMMHESPYAVGEGANQ